MLHKTICMSIFLKNKYINTCCYILHDAENLFVANDLPTTLNPTSTTTPHSSITTVTTKTSSASAPTTTTGELETNKRLLTDTIT